MSSKSFAVIGLAALLGAVPQAAAQSAPSLGKAASFAVLGTSVTNIGDSLVTGDLGFNDSNGVDPGMMRLGAVQARSSSLVRQAQRDAAAAYAALGQGPCTVVPGLLPQLFPIPGPDTVRIFCVHGDLTTAPNTAVQLLGVHDWNVFWQVAGNVTLGEHTVFAGTILAQGRITLGRGVSVSGRALALGGDVALDAASVSVCCPQIAVSTTFPLTASGGKSPYIFKVLSGCFPPTATLSTEGAITGTLTPGYFPFIAVATDAHRCAGVQEESIAVCPLLLSAEALPPGCVGQRYGATITVLNGSGSYTFTASGVPPGLDFTDGALSQSPTTPGMYTMTVTATDNVTHCTGSQQYPILIDGFQIAPNTLPDATVCEEYNQVQVLSAPGAIGNATFKKISGPDWLSVNGSGTVHGMPTAEGKVSLTVRATDMQGCSADKSYDITIRPAAPITVLPETLSNGTVDKPYLDQISARGGCCGDYTFTADPAMPVPGLTLAPKSGVGVLSGTPTTPGCFCFKVTATDCKGNSGSRDYDVCFCGHLVLVPGPELPAATSHVMPSVPYRRSLRAPGSKGAFSFRVTDGNLLPWLKLSKEGVLYGTPGPSNAFTIDPKIVFPPGFTFTVTATDSVPGCPAVSETYHVPQVFACNDVPTIKTTSLPDGTVGKPYKAPITVDTTDPAHTLSIVSGSAGELMLNKDFLEGLPTTPGTFCFAIVATDADCNCSSPPQDYTVVISQPTCPPGTTITVTTPPSASPALPLATTGKPYFQQLIASGGTARYTFSISAGALPDCLKLDPESGVISGIPNKSGLYEFTIIATDANGCVSNRCPETLTVIDPGGE